MKETDVGADLVSVSIDSSGNGSSLDASADNDGIDGGDDRDGGEIDDVTDPAEDTADVATDGGSCADVFGPVYEPDAGDVGACSADKPCEDRLICSGTRCDERWECVPHFVPHPCPVDKIPHCGCSGATFEAPSSCEDRPYDHIGACDDGVNCDPTDLRCSQEEPNCEPGTIASVIKGVYGPCVPFASCRCEYIWECPHRDKYKCDRATWRCVELPGGADAHEDDALQGIGAAP